MVEALKIVLCGYLLILAALAAVGAHRAWMLLPIRVVYASAQLLAYVFSLGRLKLSPAFARASSRGSSLRGELSSWRTRQGEEQEILRGGKPEAAVVWSSAALEKDLADPGLEDAFDTLAPPPPALKRHKGDTSGGPQSLPDEFKGD